MEKGRDKRTDTLQTDNVFTRNEYIEREALLRHLNDIWLTATPTDAMPDDDRQLAIVRCMGLNDAMDAVKDAPAADVAPVRHGRWRKAVGTSGVVRMACTNCGFMRFPENDSREPMFAYCPRCGALMDKDGVGDV